MKQFVRGDTVEMPFESVRLFALCSAMEFAVLPVAGGLYDQHPDLIEQWSEIFAEKGRHERAEMERHKREQEAQRRTRR